MAVSGWFQPSSRGERTAAEMTEWTLLRERHGLVRRGADRGGIHIWGRYIWTPSLAQVPQCKSVGLGSDALQHLTDAGVTEELNRVSHFWGTLLEQIDARIRPSGAGVALQADTKNGSFALLATGGEYTGRYRLHTEAIESSERVGCRPARNSTYICQRGTLSQPPGGSNTSN
jgi:hypothetical protein